MKKIIVLLALMLISSLSFAQPVIAQNEDGVTYDISFAIPDGACFSMCPIGKASIANVSLEQIPFQANTVPTIEIFGTSSAKNGVLDVTTRTMTFTKVPAIISGKAWNIVIRTTEHEYWVHANQITYKENRRTKIRNGFMF